jgi:hypothetical protein
VGSGRERRSDMEARTRSDALRLLRCIHDTQAPREADTRVDPPRAAQEAGLEVGSERYHSALLHLLDEGALVGDEHTKMHTEEVERPQPHAYAVYLFTERALVLLEHHGRRS